MNEHDLARKIARRLNEGLTQLGPATGDRLQRVRRRALGHYRAGRPVFGLAWVHALKTGHGPWFASPSRLWLPAAVLILGLLTVTHWHATQPGADIEDIDAALLAGDLPIHAYLDKDFHTWLESSSQ